MNFWEEILGVLYIVTVFTTCSSSQKLVWEKREAGSTETLVFNADFFLPWVPAVHNCYWMNWCSAKG